jgi:hypothetical protein
MGLHSSSLPRRKRIRLQRPTQNWSSRQPPDLRPAERPPARPRPRPMHLVVTLHGAAAGRFHRTPHHHRLLRPHLATSPPPPTGEGRNEPVLQVPDHRKMADRELSGIGDKEGGPVYRICGSCSLDAFLDHGGEELHFGVAIWVVG